MSIESIKLHTSETASDARAVIKLLQTADVSYRMVAAGSDEEIVDSFTDDDFEPVDLYIHRDDILRADQVLRPVLVR